MVPDPKISRRWPGSSSAALTERTAHPPGSTRAAAARETDAGIS